MNMDVQQTKGLLMVFTGDGKGKTTSSIGMAMRAAGHNMPVFFLQFIKGSWDYGEIAAFERFSDIIEFQVIGRGFTWKSDDIEKDREVAGKAWHKAKEAIFSNQYKMVVLDEFTYPLLYGMIDRKEVLQVLKEKPSDLHLVITGRYASNEICKIADLVTEMRPERHPYQEGVLAQIGVEY